MSKATRFEIGDCVILNEHEKPCAEMICVVVGKVGDYFECAYLNAASKFDEYCCPSMQNQLERAHRIEEFGVELRSAAGKYWVEKVGASQVKYPDGETRLWQESFVHRWAIRKEVARLAESRLKLEEEPAPQFTPEQRLQCMQEQAMLIVVNILSEEPLAQNNQWTESIYQLRLDAKRIASSIREHNDSLTGKIKK